jgi:Fe-S oxidoreductase/nitrate reductase gamma subunit
MDTLTSTNNRALDWVPASYQPLVLAFICLISLGFFLKALWPKLQVLKLAEKENRFGRPFKRLLNTIQIAFLQKKLFKNRAPGRMHALIFWGFLVLLLRAGQFFWIGFFPDQGAPFDLMETLYPVYSLIKDSFVFLVIGAVFYALYRRLVIRPERLNLSGEGILILVLILAILFSDIFFDAAWFSMHPELAEWTAPLALGISVLLGTFSNPLNLIHYHNLAFWGHIISILFFITLLPRSKHFHIITSIPNVYFANAGIVANPLPRIDFDNEENDSFGVTQILEFSWKKLLDLHTCTECGRCDQVCPALKSGKPLSPKDLTIDLRDSLNTEMPRLLHPQNNNEAPGIPLLGGIIDDETLWSCTTCGACEEECPVMIEYVNKVIDMRRGLVMSEDRYPEELTNAFRSLETNSNPWGFGRDSRADWARDLGVKLWDKESPTEYLYFVGCNGSFDSRGKKISEAVVAALKAAKVEFSILGIQEGCTGDPARRAGNEYLFDMLATQNAETFKENGVKKVITHCPHCFNSLLNEYPEFGVNLEVIHHSELLARFIAEGKISPTEKMDDKTVYHDSCYMGRHNGKYEAPREVIASSVNSGSIQEVDTSRERGSCCGAGGGRFLLEEKTGTRMSHNRIDELMQGDPDTIAVSCPFCVLMLEDALKAKNINGKVKVKDVAEIIRERE